MTRTAKVPRRPRKPAAAPHAVQLQIPCKPYIKKFLEKYLGAHYSVTFDDAYGAQLKEHMRSRPQNLVRNQGLHRYASVFTVTASSRDFKYADQLTLTSLSVVRFNKFAERVCAAEFYTLADVCMQECGITIQAAIEKFRAKFGLTEDDWDAMTMRRAYLRYRNDPNDQGQLDRPAVRNYLRREQD